MALSRKRQRELKRLKRNAEELWDEQRDAIEHASAVLRDARRQAANYAREEVGPRVRDTYEDRVRPAFATGFRAARRAASAARERFTDDVLPAISGALGSALAMLEAAKDPRVRDVVSAVSRAGQRAGSSSRRSPPAPGRYILIGLGVVAFAGVAYAAWQTLRADDDLWIEDLDDVGLGTRRGGRRILMLERAAAAAAVAAAPADRMLGAGGFGPSRRRPLRIGEPERCAARTGIRRRRSARIDHRRLGTYLHVTISPGSACTATVDPARSTPDRGQLMGRAGLLDAQRFVATFVAEQTIDSSALDRDEAGWEDWVDSTSDPYFGADAVDLMKLEGADRPTPIYNDPDNFTPRWCATVSPVSTTPPSRSTRSRTSRARAASG